MSWVTIIWAMFSSAYLTLALVHVLVWRGRREAWANLLFALSAVATAVFAGFELWAMRAETPGEFGMVVRWAHAPAWVLIVSLVGFVRLYLRAGRLWLAWTVCGLRTLSLILNFVFSPNLNYREITALRHVSFLGERVAVAEGVPNPWMLVGQLGLVLLVIFVADAALTVWRRGDRQQALLVGGSMVFFVVAGTAQVMLVLWGIIYEPIMASLFYMGIVVTMAYELSQDVLRAALNSARASSEWPWRLMPPTWASGFEMWCEMKSGQPTTGARCLGLRNPSALISMAFWKSCTPKIAKQSARLLRMRLVAQAVTRPNIVWCCPTARCVGLPPVVGSSLTPMANQSFCAAPPSTSRRANRSKRNCSAVASWSPLAC